nr:hypothetical protein BaRGS_022384 [Batillaria attramentaria]
MHVKSSSTDAGDLLKNTADFLDTLLDLSDDLCSGWASTDLVDALLEAIQQIGYKHSETLEVFLHIFQLLSTSQEGVQALVERGEEVLMPLLQYLECVCQDEIVGLEEHSACLSSVFSLLNALFMSDSAIVEKLSTSETGTVNESTHGFDSIWESPVVCNFRLEEFVC